MKKNDTELTREKRQSHTSSVRMSNMQKKERFHGGQFRFFGEKAEWEQAALLDGFTDTWNWLQSLARKRIKSQLRKK